MGRVNSDIGHVRMMSLGGPNRRDSASVTCINASELGADVGYVLGERDDGAWEYDRGGVDWGKELGPAHWLINCSSTPLMSEGAMGAWSASLTFAELEGTKAVMVIDPPGKGNDLDAPWGLVIEKIRQLHILFLHPGAIQAICEVEGLPKEDLLGQIRSRSMVPLVCTHDPAAGSIIEHAFGRTCVESFSDIGPLEWLAGLLCYLPTVGSGIAGIEEAATVAGKKK